MSYNKLVKAENESSGQRRSLEVTKENVKPLNGDQDYVIVDEGDQGSDSLAADGNSCSKSTKGKPLAFSSPAPVQVGLEAPEDPENMDRKPSAVLDLKLDTDALAAWREQQFVGRANSVGTDRTDYSGLNDNPTSGAVTDRDLQKALEEANQQHQWAMEAVIRGWESEKVDLLAKLEKMTEARDTLEAELKHSENNFAGMLEGMLDQKLDQMLIMLQDCGAKPPSARSSMSSPSTATQPTVRKAQQVVHDLGAMLETMKMQQAAIEARVSTMQSAVLQLLPDAETPKISRQVSTEFVPHFFAQGLPTPQYASPCTVLPSQPKPQLLKSSLTRIGSFCNQTRHLLCDKVPKLAHSTGSLISKAVAMPVEHTGHQAGRFIRFLQAQGIKNEHFTAVAGALCGVMVTTVLVRRIEAHRAANEPRPISLDDCDVHEIEIMGADDSEEDGSVEIILNRNGMYRRSGQDDPALVVAWPI